MFLFLLRNKQINLIRIRILSKCHVSGTLVKSIKNLPVEGLLDKLEVARHLALLLLVDAGHVLGEGGVEQHLPAVVAAAGGELLQLAAEHLLLALLRLLAHPPGGARLPHRLLRLTVRHKGGIVGLRRL